ncbi:hypothetical protein F2P81_013166 [Scophthalmus maximus]|uniref:Uncharacterized protein n=1 Tax=Scophthalmus maximus TaxID=52904 RepID=A0A6A4STG9_SCOMX|nr:hypothetical protein F2P81_013166 [Scophthalmus maximus]
MGDIIIPTPRIRVPSPKIEDHNQAEYLEPPLPSTKAKDFIMKYEQEVLSFTDCIITRNKLLEIVYENSISVNLRATAWSSFTDFYKGPPVAFHVRTRNRLQEVLSITECNLAIYRLKLISESERRQRCAAVSGGLQVVQLSTAAVRADPRARL